MSSRVIECGKNTVVRLLLLTLVLFSIKRGVTVSVPQEIVYEMGSWNDAIGIVTKSLNHSQTILGYVGIEQFSNPPDPIGGTWVGPARRLPYTVLFLLISPFYTGDYLQAFQLSFVVGYTFSALVAYPVTGYTLYRLVEECSSRSAGRLALVGFVLQQFVGWPGKPLYNLKLQHSMAIPLCLLAMYFTVRALQVEDQQIRNAVVAGSVLGVTGLTQYHYTFLTILGVFAAYTVTHRWRQFIATGLTGLGFASFYVLVPAAGTKILSKATGIFLRDSSGGSFLPAAEKVIGVLLLSGTLVIVLVSVLYVFLHVWDGRPVVDGYLYEVTLVLTWLLWFVPKTGSLRDGEAVIALWFLQVLFLIGYAVHIDRILGDEIQTIGSRFGRNTPVLLGVWGIFSILMLVFSPISP